MSEERLESWIRGERERIAARIDLFSSGRVEVHERRRDRVLDTTGDVLKDLLRRKAELDRLLVDSRSRT